MEKLFTGHCPKINDSHTISVTYNDAGETLIKGLASCSGNMQHDCPYEKECPVLSLAPEIIKK